MPDTRAVFFWMGGVLTQSIEPLMRAALASSRQPGANLFSAPGFSQACERLALGQLDDLAFCQAVVEMSKVGTSPESMREAAIASFAPAPGVSRSIQLLPDTFSRCLIVDYPRSWFEQARERLQIDACFNNDQILFLEDSQLVRLVPELFDFLAQRAGVRLDQCLIFDAISRRTVAALDHGFPSAIFVDAARLEREFVMRHFTARIPLEHRPVTVLQGTHS